MFARGILLAATALLSTVAAQTTGSPTNTTGIAGLPTPGPDSNGKYEISAEGIRANFIPYGASISNLFINDTNGVERDIVLGFDNATYYSEDKQHPHFGGVPGELKVRGIGRGSGIC